MHCRVWCIAESFCLTLHGWEDLTPVNKFLRSAGWEFDGGRKERLCEDECVHQFTFYMRSFADRESHNETVGRVVASLDRLEEMGVGVYRSPVLWARTAVALTKGRKGG